MLDPQEGGGLDAKRHYDIMSLGIKSFATEGVDTKKRCVPGFSMGSWIHDESSYHSGGGGGNMYSMQLLCKLQYNFQCE